MPAQTNLALTSVLVTYCGSPSPDCSRTMYSAYQSGQFGSASPVSFSCCPCAFAARIIAWARSRADAYVASPVTRPGSRFVTSCSTQPLPSGSLNETSSRLASSGLDWKRLSYAIRASRFDGTLVFVTAFAAIFISVEDSILIGVAVSLLLFVPRVSKLGIRELIVTPERVVRERQPDEPRSNPLLIYDLEGELFFGAAPELDRYLDEIKQETIRTGIKYIILRLRRTRNPDVVAIEHLEHFLRDAEKRGVTVLLAGVRPNLAKILRNVHLNQWLPEDRIYPEKDEKFSATLNAVRHAYRLLNQERKSEGHEAVYYLV
jgi:sulfate permease, SulP family